MFKQFKRKDVQISCKYYQSETASWSNNAPMYHFIMTTGSFIPGVGGGEIPKEFWQCPLAPFYSCHEEGKQRKKSVGKIKENLLLYTSLATYKAESVLL